MRIVPASDTHTSRNVFRLANVIVTHPEIIGNLHQYRKTIGIVHNLGSATLDGCKFEYRALIANSESTAKGLMKLGIKPSHIIKPPTVTPKIFEHHPDFVFSSNLSPSKGSDIFYYCAKKLPHIPFLGVFGGYGEQRIDTLDNLMVLGHGPLDLAMSNAKIFLSPSQTETYGMTLAEALMAGIPSIVTDIPAHREVAKDSSIFIPLGSPFDKWKETVSDVYGDHSLWEDLHEESKLRGVAIRNQSEESFEQWLSLLNML